ncbi:MAG: Coenzyme F420 hydrogenase/dehydrogenase, beta subunit C-terminal domain [Candidatus Bathyarchaeales archaeon]
MDASKIGFEASLAATVLETGRCVGCGACIAVCPHNCLQLMQGTPVLAKECQSCGLCAQACPRYDFSQTALEKFVFGRSRKPDEPFGVYLRLAVAKATDERILQTCQDGGVATALLAYALKTGQISGAVAVASSAEKPFYPKPLLASNFDEVLACAGSKYTCSPNLLLLADACKQKNGRIAFVGTPCQIQAVRKTQAAGLTRQTGCLSFLVGLMCSGCFTYEGLMEAHIHREKGVDLRGIKKMNVKGKLRLTTAQGVVEIPLAEIKRFQQKSCTACGDFSAELADISVGGLGLNGWTFTVIRTPKGEELFSSAEKAGFLRVKALNSVDKALDLLIQLSEKKRKNTAAQKVES